MNKVVSSPIMSSIRLVFTFLLLTVLGIACGHGAGEAPAQDALRLSIANGTLHLDVGESVQMQVTPTDGTGAPYPGVFVVKWTSSAPAVLAVTQNGLLTGVANGAATMTATATRLDTQASATATASVTVGLGPADAGGPLDAGGPVDSGSSDGGSGDAGSSSPGLVASYGFSEGAGTTVADSSGNGHTGSFVGSPVWAAGVHGGGVTMNGVAGHIAVGDLAALDGVKALTVSSWIKTTATSEKHVVDKSHCDGAANGGPFEFGTGFFTAGRATLIVYKGGGSPDYSYVESAASVADGAWHHIAGVYDGTNLAIYVDGALSATKSLPGLTLAATSNLVEIGGNCNGNSYLWDGSLDDLRLYSRALGQSEIVTDMNNAVSQNGPVDAGLADSGLADAGAGGYFIDFTTAALQDPLSAGGLWTNNSQGTGGNAVCVDKASMRVALAKDGVTKIAQHAAAPVSGYNDSFAFVPGISATGNIRVTVTIYRHPNYNPQTPPDNHELEIIIGAKVAGAQNSKWIECLLNNNGGGSSDIILLDGTNKDFQFLGGVVGNIPAPYDGMMWRAELDRSTNPHRVRWGWSDDGGVTWKLGCDSQGRPNANLITNLGDGAGIASYRTSLGGSPPSESGGMGFRNFRVETYTGPGTAWK